MSNYYPIKAGFKGGFLSASARGQVNTKEYDTGFSECENWNISPQGSIQYRLGSRITSKINSDGIDGRLITFPVSTSESKILVMDGQNISVYDQLGLVQGTGVLSADPMFDKKPSGWKNGGIGFGANWVYSQGKRVHLSVHATLGNPVGQPNTVYIWQKVHLLAGTFTLKFGYATETRVSGIAHLTATPLIVKVGSTKNANDIFEQEVAGGAWDSPEKYEFTFTLAAPQDVFIRAGLKPRNSADPYSVIQGAIYAPFFITDGSSAPVVFVSPWDDTQLPEVQIAVDSGLNEMYFAHKDVQPYLLKYTPATHSWAFNPVVFTNKPVEWAAGNWPSVTTIFQSRLWLGGTPSQPNSIWASRVGKYNVFTVGTNADDSLAFVVSTSGTFKWFLGRDFLLIGTDEGEWMLGAAEQRIAPADFYFVQQTGYACAGVQPIFIGQQICYVGASFSRIRVTNSSYEAQGWVGMDISLIADELLFSGVKELKYASEPNYTLYCVNADGTVGICCYDKNNQMLSWSSIRIANGGRILSMAITSESRGSAAWVLVERGGIITLEIIEPHRSVEEHLDSFTVQPVFVERHGVGAYDESYSNAYNGGALPQSQWIVRIQTGLEYYEGQEVGVVYHDTNNPTGAIVRRFVGNFTVRGGIIDLPKYVGEGNCAIGFTYKATATTLPNEGGNRAGTSQGSKRKWNRIFARIARSVLPYLNGYRPIIDQMEIVDQDNPYGSLLTGDYEVRNEGFDDGVVTIENEIPLHCEVAAIFGKSQSNET